MRVKIKSITAVLLTGIMCLQFGISVPAAGRISSGQERTATVVDLSKRSVVESVGLPVSGVYTKSGDYTAELSGKNLKRNFSFKTRTDWSDYNTLQMWVYSPIGVQTPITIALISDNPETAVKDYYYATEEIGELGWNLLSIPYDEEHTFFIENGDPKGFSEIDRVEIWTNFDGKKADISAQLYMDKMTIVKLNEAEVDEVIEGLQSNGSGAGTGSGAAIGNGSGNGSGGNEDKTVLLSGGFTLEAASKSIIPECTDWSEYNTLVIKATTTAPSTVPYLMRIESQNPETTGNDYWYTHIQFDWTGSGEIVFDLSNYDNYYSFSDSGICVGTDSITCIYIAPGTYTINPELNEKNFSNGYPLVTVESVSLENRDWKTPLFGENSGDYIPSAKLEDGFHDYAADLRENETQHPRLILDGEYVEALKTLTNTDSYLNSSLAALKSSADTLLAKGPIKPNPEGGLSDLPGVVLVYNITGEQKYADWIWESMYNIMVNSAAWNNGTFLNTGDKLREMSLCYDWMYNHWTEEQRRIVRNGIMHHGIEYVLRETRCYAAWAGTAKNNLGQIMMSGLGTAAMALLGDNPAYDDLLNECLNRCLIVLRNIMPEVVEPSGEYREGVAYWSYGMGNYYKLVQSMYTTFGSTELIDMEGVIESGLFPIAMTGSEGFYNFGDGFSSAAVSSGAFFFMTQYTDNPMYGAYQMQYGGNDYYSLAAYRPDERYKNYEKYMPTATYYADKNEILTVRKNWSDPDAFSIGLKAGGNFTGSHMQYDIGSFIFDSMGERWITELGRDDYTLEGRNPLGRAGMYRIRSEGNNCLVINPDEGPGQNTDVSCEIDEYKVTDSGVYAVMDLSEAYEGMGVRSVKRGFAVLNNFGSLLIQDEIKTEAPAEIYSFMHTNAKVEVAEDGKSAVLELNKKKMRAKLLSPADATLMCMEADYLPTSNAAPSFDNSAFKKLAVHVENATNPTVSVLLTPYQEDIENEFSIDEVVPLRNFKNYLKHPVYVDQIYLDGVPIPNFRSAVSNYSLSENEVGVISADASDDFEIEIKQAEALGETACITAISNKSHNRAVYTITFSDEAQNNLAGSYYTPTAILTGDGSKGEEAVDGDLETAWGNGTPGCWIGFDLGEKKELTEVKVKWSQGSARYTYFDLEVSDDAVNWRNIYSDGRSYMTDGFETYSFEPLTARYIRLVGNGNSTNSWTTLYEIRITSHEAAFADISEHWAATEIQNLANVGIVSGDAAGNYNPDSEITRAEYLAMLQAVCGFSNGVYKGSFADVTEDAWYMECVEGAYILGLIPDEMIADNKFCPDKPISCEEMMAFAVKAYNMVENSEEVSVELSGYEYAENISPWCVPYMKNAKAVRLLGGSLVENGFNPTQNATKAQAAVLARRVYVKIH